MTEATAPRSLPPERRSGLRGFPFGEGPHSAEDPDQPQIWCSILALSLGFVGCGEARTASSAALECVGPALDVAIGTTTPGPLTYRFQAGAQPSLRAFSTRAEDAVRTSPHPTSCVLILHLGTMQEYLVLADTLFEQDDNVAFFRTHIVMQTIKDQTALTTML